MPQPRDRPSHRRRTATAGFVAGVGLLAACTGSGTGSAGTSSTITAPSTPATEVPVPTPSRSSGPAPGDDQTASAAVDGPAGRITLHAFGPDGTRLGAAGFAAIETNGVGLDGVDDTIVESSTLRVLTLGPIQDSGDGNLAIDRPAGPVALSLAWPTSLGYSTLIIDLPAPGTYVFNLLAARQAVHDASVGGPLQPAAQAGLDEARTHLATAEAAAKRSPVDEVAVAKAADLALDAAVTAALAPRSPRRTAADGVITGITTTHAVSDPAIWSSVRTLAGDREPWARIVFDPKAAPSEYRGAIAAAHAAGVKVLGQLLDSSGMAQVPLAAFETRTQRYVDALTDVDAWEVGNEVNGNWLGPDVTEKVGYAARYVKAHTSARTVLTLYWNLGEDQESTAMFNWAAEQLDAGLMASIDDVAVSMWVEEHPMGIAFDRVFATLARRFPGHRLLVGELGYGNPDLDHTWWWGSRTDRTGAGRRAVAATYQALALDRPVLAGGGFWWYYLEDAYPPAQLWDTLAGA